MFNISLVTPYTGLYNEIMNVTKHGEIASRISDIANAYGLPQHVVVCAANIRYGRATALLNNCTVILVHFAVVDGKVVIDCQKSADEILNAITTNTKMIGLKK